MGEAIVTDTRKAAAIWLPIADLAPWDKNPRKNADAVAKVAESIERFGFSHARRGVWVGGRAETIGKVCLSICVMF